jgi:single-strand DNA-binding protein
MNKIILIGRLTKDSELRYSPTGMAVVKNSIAVDDGFGEKKKTDFFNIVCFGKTAEATAQYTEKGSKVSIIGKLKTNSYEKDGVKVNNVEIIIEEIEFLSLKKNDKKQDFTDISDVDLPF